MKDSGCPAVAPVDVCQVEEVDLAKNLSLAWPNGLLMMTTSSYYVSFKTFSYHLVILQKLKYDWFYQSRSKGFNKIINLHPKEFLWGGDQYFELNYYVLITLDEVHELVIQNCVQTL